MHGQDERIVELLAVCSAEGYCPESTVWNVIEDYRVHEERYPEWYGEGRTCTKD